MLEILIDFFLKFRSFYYVHLVDWIKDTILNFPLSTYENEVNEMEGQSKEEYIGSLRRYVYKRNWQ
ncbi:unnamed protein product [Coffea canephora]|uniref:Uncharacterized protein n=1 Tax=Coffea canephora TaxID=49390 RepID=A0A068USF3_COFCA|nr:unnamed protein product [Coffea canephora]